MEQRQGVEATAKSLKQHVTSLRPRSFLTTSLFLGYLAFVSLPLAYSEHVGSGGDAKVVMGQADFYSGSVNRGSAMASANALAFPMGTATDGHRLIVADYSNNRVLIWNTIPTSNDQPADVVLGQSDFVSTRPNRGIGLGPDTLKGPMAVATDGTKLVVVDTLNSRVLIWNTFPTANGQWADVVLGQPDMSTGVPGNDTAGVPVSASRLAFPEAVALINGVLYVADTDNARVLIWNVMPTVNGRQATYVLGQPTFTSNARGTSASQLYAPSGVAADPTNQRCYVADSHRILVWSQAVPPTGASASSVLGQPTFGENLPSHANAATPLNRVGHLAAPRGHLLAADRGHHRVAVFTNLPTGASTPGLTLGATNTAGTTPSLLRGPNGVVAPSEGLNFIVDTDNHRVLLFKGVVEIFGSAVAPAVMVQSTEYPLFAFTLKTQTGTGTFVGLTLKVEGAANANDIARFKLFQENGAQSGFQAAGDTSLDSRPWAGTLVLTLPGGGHVIGTTPAIYYISLVTTTLSADDRTIRVFIEDQSSFGIIGSPSAFILLPLQTSSVLHNAALLGLAAVTLSLGVPARVAPATWTPVMRLTLNRDITDAALTWTRLDLSLPGTIQPGGVQARLYFDTDGNTLFSGAETLAATGTFASDRMLTLHMSAPIQPGTVFTALVDVHPGTPVQGDNLGLITVNAASGVTTALSVATLSPVPVVGVSEVINKWRGPGTGALVLTFNINSTNNALSFTMSSTSGLVHWTKLTLVASGPGASSTYLNGITLTRKSGASELSLTSTAFSPSMELAMSTQTLSLIALTYFVKVSTKAFNPTNPVRFTLLATGFELSPATAWGPYNTPLPTPSLSVQLGTPYTQTFRAGSLTPLLHYATLPTLAMTIAKVGSPNPVFTNNWNTLAFTLLGSVVDPADVTLQLSLQSLFDPHIAPIAFQADRTLTLSAPTSLTYTWPASGDRNYWVILNANGNTVGTTVGVSLMSLSTDLPSVFDNGLSGSSAPVSVVATSAPSIQVGTAPAQRYRHNSFDTGAGAHRYLPAFLLTITAGSSDLTLTEVNVKAIGPAAYDEVKRVMLFRDFDNPGFQPTVGSAILASGVTGAVSLAADVFSPADPMTLPCSFVVPALKTTLCYVTFETGTLANASFVSLTLEGVTASEAVSIFAPQRVAGPFFLNNAYETFTVLTQVNRAEEDASMFGTVLHTGTNLVSLFKITGTVPTGATWHYSAYTLLGTVDASEAGLQLVRTAPTPATLAAAGWPTTRMLLLSLAAPLALAANDTFQVQLTLGPGAEGKTAALTWLGDGYTNAHGSSPSLSGSFSTALVNSTVSPTFRIKVNHQTVLTHDFDNGTRHVMTASHVLAVTMTTSDLRLQAVTLAFYGDAVAQAVQRVKLYRETRTAAPFIFTNGRVTSYQDYVELSPAIVLDNVNAVLCDAQPFASVVVLTLDHLARPELSPLWYDDEVRASTIGRFYVEVEASSLAATATFSISLAGIASTPAIPRENTETYYSIFTVNAYDWVIKSDYDNADARIKKLVRNTGNQVNNLLTGYNPGQRITIMSLPSGPPVTWTEFTVQYSGGMDPSELTAFLVRESPGNPVTLASQGYTLNPLNPSDMHFIFSPSVTLAVNDVYRLDLSLAVTALNKSISTNVGYEVYQGVHAYGGTGQALQYWSNPAASGEQVNVKSSLLRTSFDPWSGEAGLILLSLSTSGLSNQTDWFSLRLSFTQPPSDDSLSELRLYKDDGDGSLSFGDIPIGTLALGSNQSPVLTFPPQTIVNQPAAYLLSGIMQPVYPGPLIKLSLSNAPSAWGFTPKPAGSPVVTPSGLVLSLKWRDKGRYAAVRTVSPSVINVNEWTTLGLITLKDPDGGFPVNTYPHTVSAVTLSVAGPAPDQLSFRIFPDFIREGVFNGERDADEPLTTLVTNPDGLAAGFLTSPAVVTMGVFPTEITLASPRFVVQALPAAAAAHVTTPYTLHLKGLLSPDGYLPIGTGLGEYTMVFNAYPEAEVRVATSILQTDVLHAPGFEMPYAALSLSVWKNTSRPQAFATLMALTLLLASDTPASPPGDLGTQLSLSIYEDRSPFRSFGPEDGWLGGGSAASTVRVSLPPRFLYPDSAHQFLVTAKSSAGLSGAPRYTLTVGAIDLRSTFAVKTNPVGDPVMTVRFGQTAQLRLLPEDLAPSSFIAGFDTPVGLLKLNEPLTTPAALSTVWASLYSAVVVTNFAAFADKFTVKIVDASGTVRLTASPLGPDTDFYRLTLTASPPLTLEASTFPQRLSLMVKAAPQTVAQSFKLVLLSAAGSPAASATLLVKNYGYGDPLERFEFGPHEVINNSPTTVKLTAMAAVLTLGASAFTPVVALTTRNVIEDYLPTIRVRIGSGASDGDVAEVAWHQDLNGNGVLDASDPLVASAVPVNGVATLSPPERVTLPAYLYRYDLLSYRLSVQADLTHPVIASLGPEDVMVGRLFASQPAFSTPPLTLTDSAGALTVTGEAVPANALPPSTTRALAVLTLAMNQDLGRIRTLRVSLTGTTDGSHIAGLQAYRDHPDGIFSSQADTLVASATFGPDRWATLTVGYASSPLQVVSAGTPAVWWLGLTILSHAALDGSTAGLSLGSIATNPQDTVNAFSPITSAPTVIDQASLVSVTLTRLLPVGSLVAAGESRLAWTRMDVFAEQRSAILTTLALWTSATQDGDVARVDLYRDGGTAGAFDVSTDSLLATAAFGAGALTFGNLAESLPIGTVTSYFLAVSLTPSVARANQPVGLSLRSSSFVTSRSIDTIQALPGVFAADRVTLAGAVSVYVTGGSLAPYHANPQIEAPLLAVTLAANGRTTLTRFSVVSSNSQVADVETAALYHDRNGNRFPDGGESLAAAVPAEVDGLFTAAFTGLALSLEAAAPSRLIVTYRPVAQPVANNVLSAEIAGPAQLSFSVGTASVAAPIQSGQSVLQALASLTVRGAFLAPPGLYQGAINPVGYFTLRTEPGRVVGWTGLLLSLRGSITAGTASLHLYPGSAVAGSPLGTAVWTPGLITLDVGLRTVNGNDASPKVHLLAVSLGHDTLGQPLALTLNDGGLATSGDQLDPSGFPFGGGPWPVLDQEDTVSLATFATLAPPGDRLLKGDANIPLLKFSLDVNRDQVVLQKIRVTAHGPTLPPDGTVTLKLWRSLSDAAFQSASDELLASGLLTQGVAVIQGPDVPVRDLQEPQAWFITADVADTGGPGGGAYGAHFGLSLTLAGDNLPPTDPDLVINAVTPTSGLYRVYDTQPLMMVDTNTLGTVTVTARGAIAPVLHMGLRWDRAEGAAYPPMAMVFQHALATSLEWALQVTQVAVYRDQAPVDQWDGAGGELLVADQNGGGVSHNLNQAWGPHQIGGETPTYRVTLDVTGIDTGSAPLTLTTAPQWFYVTYQLAYGSPSTLTHQARLTDLPRFVHDGGLGQITSWLAGPSLAGSVAGARLTPSTPPASTVYLTYTAPLASSPQATLAQNTWNLTLSTAMTLWTKISSPTQPAELASLVVYAEPATPLAMLPMVTLSAWHVTAGIPDGEGERAWGRFGPDGAATLAFNRPILFTKSGGSTDALTGQESAFHALRLHAFIGLGRGGLVTSGQPFGLSLAASSFRWTNNQSVQVLTMGPTTNNFGQVSTTLRVTQSAQGLTLQSAVLAPYLKGDQAVTFAALTLSMTNEQGALWALSLKWTSSTVQPVTLFVARDGGAHGPDGADVVVGGYTLSAASGADALTLWAAQTVSETPAMTLFFKGHATASDLDKALQLTLLPMVSAPDTLCAVPPLGVSLPVYTLSRVRVRALNLVSSSKVTRAEALPMLALSLDADLPLRWLALTLTQTQASFDPADVTAVRLYRDADGNGRWNEAVDVLVADGAVSAARVTFAMTAETLWKSQYLAVAHVSRQAGKNHQLALGLAESAALLFDNAGGVSGTFPTVSAPIQVEILENILSIQGAADRLPAGGFFSRHTLVPVLALTMASDGPLVWRGLVLSNDAPGAADTDVAQVRLLFDANQNLSLDAGDRTLATAAFVNRAASLGFTAGETLGIVANAVYLVGYEIGSSTPVNQLVGASLPGASNFIVDAPHVAGTRHLPFGIPHRPVGGKTDALELHLLAGVTQAEPGLTAAPLIRLSCRLTNAAAEEAWLTSLTLSLAGTLPFEALSNFQLIVDDNGSGTWESGETRLDGAVDILNRLVTFAPGAGATLRVTTPRIWPIVADLGGAPGQYYGMTAALSLAGAVVRQDVVTGPDTAAFANRVGPSIRLFDAFVKVSLSSTPLTGGNVEPGTAGAWLLALTLAADHRAALASRLTVERIGTAPHPARLWIMRETNAAAGWQADDATLASAWLFAGPQTLTFTPPLTVTESAPVILYGIADTYPWVSASGERVQFQITAKTDLALASTPAGQVFGAFPATSGVLRLTELASTKDALRVSLAPLVRGYARVGAPTPLLKYSLAVERVQSGGPGMAVGVAALSLLITRQDFALDQFLGLTLFEDVNRDGFFQFGQDTLVIAGRGGVGQSAFGFQPAPAFPGAPAALIRGGSPRTWFVVGTLSPTSSLEIPLVLQVANQDLLLQDASFAGAAGAPEVRGIPSPSAVFQFQLASTLGVPNTQLSLAVTSYLPATAPRGTERVTLAKLALHMDTAMAFWNALAVRRVGTAQDEDLTALYLYRDAEAGQTGAWVDGEDPLIATGTWHHGIGLLVMDAPEFIQSQPSSYFLMASFSPAARPGAQFGFELEPKSFRMSVNTNVVSTNMPYRSVLLTLSAPQPVVLTLGAVTTGAAAVNQGQAAALLRVTMANGGVMWSGLTLVRATPDEVPGEVFLVRDANADGTWQDLTDPPEPIVSRTVLGALTTLTGRERIPSSGGSYLVIVKPSPLAIPGRALTLSLSGAGALAPDDVFIAGYAAAAVTIGDAPDTVGVSAAAVTGDTMEPGEPQVMLDVTLALNRDHAVVTGLSLAIATTLSTGEYSLWLAPLDGSRRLGFDGLAETLALPLTRYRVMVDITDTAPPGAGVAVTLHQLTVAAPDLVTWGGPMGMPPRPLRDLQEPLPPDLRLAIRYLKTKGDLGFDWEVGLKRGQLQDVVWTLVQSTLSAVDVKTQLLSTLTTDVHVVVPWTAAGAGPTVTHQGLVLAQGLTYFVALKAKSSFNKWSPLVVSDPLVADGLKPVMGRRPPEAAVNKKRLTLAWETPEVGPSKIKHFLIERRKGHKPKWETLAEVLPPAELAASAPPLRTIVRRGAAALETKTAKPRTSVRNARGAVEYGDLTTEDGTSYYRVRAVSGAGETSEPTTELKVNAGLDNLAGIINDVSNYPNPFESDKTPTTLVYTLKQDVNITVMIYDVLGNPVRKWECAAGASGGQAGVNEISWDGLNGANQKVAAGMYLCVIKADSAGAQNRVIRKIGVIH